MPDRSLLTHEAFGEALDRYGHDLDQWPERLQHQGESLLSSSRTARQMMDEARFIAEALAGGTPPRADPSLVGRIMTQAGLPDRAPALSARSTAQVIRPDWSRRSRITVDASKTPYGQDEETYQHVAPAHSGVHRYLAVAAIVAVGLVLGWSSGPLTSQEGLSTTAGLAAYLSL